MKLIIEEKTMNNFLVGQIVKLREAPLLLKYQGHSQFENRPRILQNSVHVLTAKDIETGYYFTNIGSFDLKDCEVVTDDLQYYRWCTAESGYNQGLLGAVTKPISLNRYYKITYERVNKDITTCIFIKNTLTKVTGSMYDMCLYWRGLNNDHYRTKLKTTKEGYVIGRDVLIKYLSEKRLNQCYKLGE